MTAWGNVELAVDAMQRGATDFVQKPWDDAPLVGTIEKQAREAAARRSAVRQARSELEIARHVQQKLFPQPVKRLATIRYAARCVPARDVSGDYYDFLDLIPGSLGFVLADVSGKGIAAALLMASPARRRRAVRRRPRRAPRRAPRQAGRGLGQGVRARTPDRPSWVPDRRAGPPRSGWVA